MKKLRIVLVYLLVHFSSLCQAQTVSELSFGDFSNVRTAPTMVGQLQVGTNSITGATGMNDQDILTFTVGAGFAISDLVITEFSGPEGDEGHFFGLAAGSIAPSFSTQYLQADLISTLDGDIPYDVFDFNGAFFTELTTASLPSGDYTLFFNETSGAAGSVPYSASIVVTAIPEPASFGCLLLGAGSLAIRRRRNGVSGSV